jgi:hypothetical protein
MWKSGICNALSVRCVYMDVHFSACYSLYLVPVVPLLSCVLDTKQPLVSSVLRHYDSELLVFTWLCIHHLHALY